MSVCMCTYVCERVSVCVHVHVYVYERVSVCVLVYESVCICVAYACSYMYCVPHNNQSMFDNTLGEHVHSMCTHLNSDGIEFRDLLTANFLHLTLN